jgi:protein-S-isoprenylcysteine O-methyltransferase Ste14
VAHSPGFNTRRGCVFGSAKLVVVVSAALPAQTTAVSPVESQAKITTWIGAVLRLAMFPVVLLLPAGTWRWWEAWALFGIYLLYSVVVVTWLARHDPELLRERLKGGLEREQKRWDKVVMTLMLGAGLGILIVPGLDVVRFAWTERLPIWVEVIALGIHLPCFFMIGAVLRENTYLSPVVKIDEARGHHVITTGPYAIVRHPMYVAAIFMILAMPLALGSRWGLVPAAAMVLVLIVRTVLEDRTLHAELPGYPEYAQTTRYRLIPGIW